MALTHSELVGLKATGQLYRQAVGNGLCIEVTARGVKHWRLRYRLRVGTETRARMAALGRFPDVGLKAARERAEEMRAMIRKGVDPVLHASLAKREQAAALANTFDKVLERELALLATTASPNYVRDVGKRMQRHILPTLGRLPVGVIDVAMLRELREKVTAACPSDVRKLLNVVSKVFARAVREQLIVRNPCELLDPIQATPKATKQPALVDPVAFGQLMRDVNGLAGQPHKAIMLSAYLYTRASELTAAPWSEFDLDAGVWVIPGERMKMSRDHVVYLPTQAVKILRELRDENPDSPWVLPLPSDQTKCMHRQTPNNWLRDLLPAYRGRHVVHGFRASASTALREALYKKEAVESSLAHETGSETERAYNRAAWADYQRGMRQAYANYIGHLCDGMDAAEACRLLREARRELHDA